MLVVCVLPLRSPLSSRSLSRAVPAPAGAHPSRLNEGTRMRRTKGVDRALPPRLRWFVLAVVAAGIPVVAAAAVPAFRTPPSWHVMLGVSMVFVFALLAEWRGGPTC